MRRSDALARVARTAFAGAALAALAGATGCYSYRMRAADDAAAGLTQSHVLHSFFWGAIQGDARYHHCALHGHADGNGLWQVELQPTPLDIVTRVLTLGIWAPIHVAYDCSPRRPDVEAAGQAVALAEAVVPDTEPVDDRGCYAHVTWTNISGRVTDAPFALCVPKPGRGKDAASRAAPLVALVQEAEAHGQRVRPVGAGWSFSQAPAGKDYVVDMRWFSGALPVPADDDYAPGARGHTFAHFEGGASVDAVNLALLGAGKELLTMGGSAGQTWVGAAQTGTHGSAIDRQPIADHLWALDVVSQGGQRYWIESKSRPLTLGAYAAAIGATFVQDDGVFDAALAGLGTFGVVYSAVVETETVDDYKRYRTPMAFDATLRAVMKSLDFTAWAASPRPGERPYHFEVVVDPYNDYNGVAGSRSAYVTTLWNMGRRVDPPSAAPGGNIPSSELGKAIRRLVNADPASVPFLVKTIVGMQYPAIGASEPSMPLRSIFPKGIPQGSQPQSAEFDFARERFDEAIAAILATIDDHTPGGGPLFYYPGVLGIRFVKQTSALLGATIFPDTVTVEFAGIPGVRGLDDFYRRVDAALTAAGVAHTQHLGQANTYMEQPGGLRPAFASAGADRVCAYRAAREGFLTPTARKTFSNEYTDRLGLTAGAVAGQECPAAATAADAGTATRD